MINHFTNGFKILSIPFGPNVDFTKSPTAMAPTKEDFFKIIDFIKIKDLEILIKFD